MIVGIDGPSCSGKSTISKMLAQRLSFVYLNTGAIYRVMTINILNNLGTNPTEDQIAESCKNVIIELGLDENKKEFVKLNGCDVTNKIRTPEISKYSAVFAKYPKLRAIVKRIQKHIAQNNNIVIEGRDICTEVFPNAEVKIFLTASDEVRAKRRLQDYHNQGREFTFEQVLKELKMRDELDEKREISKLMPAKDSVIIYNNGNDPEVVINQILNLVAQKQLK